MAKPGIKKAAKRSDGMPRLQADDAISPSMRLSPNQVMLNRVLFGLLLTWTFVSCCCLMFDTDFWWHLKTGEWILEHGTIPAWDLYTVMDSEKRWIDLHWGFQLLVTFLYRLGGVPLVTLAKAACTTAAVGFAWLASGSKLAAWKKSLIWIFPVICICGRANERPEMLTMLFLALWLWIIQQSDTRPKLFWFLPLVQLAWVNCHALFVLGVVVGVCYAVDAVVRDVFGGKAGLDPRTGGPGFRTIWIVGGLVAVACFVNPYFEDGAFFPLILYRKFSTEKAFYSVNIGEFRPPIEFIRIYGWSSFRNIYLNAEIATFLIGSVSFLVLARKTRWSPLRVLLFAGFSHLAWQATRNTNIFAMVAGVVACQNLAAAEQLAVPEPSLVKPTRRLIGVYAAMVFAVVSGAWDAVSVEKKNFGLGEASDWFIHDAARFAGQPGFPDWAFVANNGQADVYLYHNAPDRRVFMDARLEVCTQETFQAYNEIRQRMISGDPSWIQLFHSTSLPVVILDRRTSLLEIMGMFHMASWKLVFADRTAAVFLPADVAEQLKLPLANAKPLFYLNGKPPGPEIKEVLPNSLQEIWDRELEKK